MKKFLKNWLGITQMEWNLALIHKADVALEKDIMRTVRSELRMLDEQVLDNVEAHLKKLLNQETLIDSVVERTNKKQVNK